MWSTVPVTVTVCGVFQVWAVKIRLAGLGVPAAGCGDLRCRVTSDVGADASATEKIAVPPRSVVTRPPWGMTRRAAAVGTDMSGVAGWGPDISVMPVCTGELPQPSQS